MSYDAPMTAAEAVAEADVDLYSQAEARADRHLNLATQWADTAARYAVNGEHAEATTAASVADTYTRLAHTWLAALTSCEPPTTGGVVLNAGARHGT